MKIDGNQLTQVYLKNSSLKKWFTMHKPLALCHIIGTVYQTWQYS